MQELQETPVQSLGWEDPLEEDTTTHSSVLAGRILWTDRLTGHSPEGFKELDMTNANLLYSSVLCGSLNDKEIQKRVHIHIADSLCSTVETNTTL